MAKTKSAKRKAGKRLRPKVTVRKSRGGLTPYQKLLVDPCNASPKSYYGGEQGVVQRLVQDITLNTVAGTTAGYLVFAPAANAYVVFNGASPSIPGSPAFFVGPGAGFLGQVSNKIRSLAACITCVPSAVSMTNITGEIGMAVITYQQFSTTGSYSVDQAFQLCNERKVLAKKEYEAKWYPGGLDQTYAGTFNTGGNTGTAALTDPSDNNAILLCWRGYAPGVAISFRLTNVVEWTPASGQGLSVTSAPNPPYNVHAESSNLHRKDASWWHTHANQLGHLLTDAGSKLVSSGLEKGVAKLSEMMLAVL